MLLKLKKKVNLTLAVGTLPLPPQFNFIPPGRMCLVAGWGMTEAEVLDSNTLQEVKLRLMDPQACRQFMTFDHNLQLCVGNPRKTNLHLRETQGVLFYVLGWPRALSPMAGWMQSLLLSSPRSPITGPGSMRSSRRTNPGAQDSLGGNLDLEPSSFSVPLTLELPLVPTEVLPHP